MWLEILKRYSSYSFHTMSKKLHGDIGYHGGIQAVTFLNNVALEILTWESRKIANVRYLENE